MCQRHLRWPVRLIAVVVVLVCVLLGGLLWGSGRIKNKVSRWEVSSEDVMKVAQTLVATNPAVRNPVSFSGIDQTTVEHWDGRRWRVSGYIDTRPQPGVKVPAGVPTIRKRRRALEIRPIYVTSSETET